MQVSWDPTASVAAHFPEEDETLDKLDVVGYV
jgi:hypothetical protein